MTISPTARRTRRDIRSAALELACERGVDAVTVEEIADRAGISRRTVFNHFPGKLEIYLPERFRFSTEALDEFASGVEPDLRAALDRLLLSRLGGQGQQSRRDLLLLLQLSSDSADLRMLLQERSDENLVGLTHCVARRFGTDTDSPRVGAFVSLVRAIQHFTVQSWLRSEDSGPTALEVHLRAVTDAMVSAALMLVDGGPPGGGGGPAQSLPGPSVPGLVEPPVAARPPTAPRADTVTPS